MHVLSTLITDKRYPRRPSRTRKISRLVSPPNGGNRYGVRMTAYYKVRFLHTVNVNYISANLKASPSAIDIPTYLINDVFLYFH